MYNITQSRYLITHVHALLYWLTRHFDGWESNRHAMQAVDSQSYGLYALVFLEHTSVGGNLEILASIFSHHHFAKNERRVAPWFQQ